MRKKRLILPILLTCSVLLSACGSGTAQPEAVMPRPAEAPPSPISTQEPTAVEDTEVLQVGAEEEVEMKLLIGDMEVSVQWEDNESVSALRELVDDEPLTISMAMYGGFEQVGSIETSLPRNDVQTVTEAGDIVLYAGNQIVIFYGSNSWAYTRLGKITDQSAEELAELLGKENVEIRLEMK